MIKVQQTLFGKGGNCFAACIASIFELPLGWVPNFCAETRMPWLDFANHWLAPLGLMIINLRILEEGEFEWPRCYHIISGHTVRHPKLLHSVVGFAGKMVHDPHPDGSGLTEVRDYDVFVCLDPAKSDAVSALRATMEPCSAPSNPTESSGS